MRAGGRASEREGDPSIHPSNRCFSYENRSIDPISVFHMRTGAGGGGGRGGGGEGEGGVEEEDRERGVGAGVESWRGRWWRVVRRVLRVVRRRWRTRTTRLGSGSWGWWRVRRGRTPRVLRGRGGWWGRRYTWRWWVRGAVRGRGGGGAAVVRVRVPGAVDGGGGGRAGAGGGEGRGGDGGV